MCLVNISNPVESINKNENIIRVKPSEEKVKKYSVQKVWKHSTHFWSSPWELFKKYVYWKFEMNCGKLVYFEPTVIK